MSIKRSLQHAVEVKLVGPNPKGEYRVNCPFCEAIGGKPDLKQKMNLLPAKGVYYCYKCETGGRADLSWLGARVEHVADQKAEPINFGPPEGFIPISDKSRLLDPYRTYLQKRSVYGAAVPLGVGACLSGPYAGRIVIPHKNEAYIWQGFVARAVFGREPKYLYPAGMDRRSGIWNYATVGRTRFEDAVWVVEGVFDALPLWPYGVATFGKNVTDNQIDRLLALKRQIVVCLDGDAWEEGQALAMRFILRDHPALWCKLPPGEDPGSIGWQVRNFIQAS